MINLMSLTMRAKQGDNGEWMKM